MGRGFYMLHTGIKWNGLWKWLQGRNTISMTVAASNFYQKGRDDLQEEGRAPEMSHGSHPLQGIQLNGSPFSFFELRVLRGDREWVKSMGQGWQSRICVAVEWTDVSLLSSGQCNPSIPLVGEWLCQSGHSNRLSDFCNSGHFESLLCFLQRAGQCQITLTIYSKPQKGQKKVSKPLLKSKPSGHSSEVLCN